MARKMLTINVVLPSTSRLNYLLGLNSTRLGTEKIEKSAKSFVSIFRATLGSPSPETAGNFFGKQW